MARILLVEPDRIQADLIEKILSSQYRVDWVRSSYAAIRALDSSKYDLIVTESTLDHHNGVELLNEIRAYEDWLDIPIIMLSAVSSSRFPVSDNKLKSYGVVALLSKSVTRPGLLLKKVAEALA